MNSDAAMLIESILSDAEKLQRDLDRLRREFRSDDPEVLEAVARANANAALVKRIRESIKGEGDILELH